MARRIPKSKDEKLRDAFADSEMFIESAIGETEEALKSLRKTKAALRTRRLAFEKRMRDLGRV